MAYRLPSTAIYQLLENAGGAANVTPDLAAVIIGPLWNVVSVTPGDSVSLAKTRSTEFSAWPKAAAA